MQDFAGAREERSDSIRGNSDRARLPTLSIVLPTDRPESISRVLEQLRKQTIASDLEVVVATPFPDGFEALRAEGEGLHSVAVVAVTDLDSLGEARARGVRAARADCVFLGETHSFAGTGDWAELLVRRHREGWGVVVPGFRNANPDSVLSWAGFLLDYGGWEEHLEAGQITYWPLNNACCDRAMLLQTGGDIANALSAGDQLILAMRAVGCRVYLEPGAVTRHLNITHWRPWLAERWIGGHLAAWHRSRDWAGVRRLLYSAASPVIAIVLFSRVWRPAWHSLRINQISIAVVPAMFLAAFVHALGECFGYLRLGSLAASEKRMSQYELHKVRFV